MQLTRLPIRTTLTRRLLTLAACAALAVTTGASALALHVNASAQTKRRPSKLLHVSAKAIAGNRISGKNPVYPPEAKKKHIEGRVVVKAEISKQGKVVSAFALSGPQILRQPSVDAIRTWEYKPVLLNGRPVAVETHVCVVYSLRKKGDPLPKPPSAPC